MIEGMKFDIPTEEMADHLKARVTYHREKATFYQAQCEALLAQGERPQGVSNDPVQSLEMSARTHRQKAALLEFILDHLIADEIYRLSESDLGRLEILDRWL